MTLRSFISADLFLHTTEPSWETADSPTVVFFIPGNPGLLGYYLEFLSLLSTSLVKILPGHSQASNYFVAGFSLGGFEVATSEAANLVPEPIQAIQQPQAAPSGSPLSLRDQIELTYLRVNALGQRIHRERTGPPHGTPTTTTSSSSTKSIKVILIGHSVGAYIALEVIRQQLLHHQDVRGEDPSTTPCTIIGAILLTPTIVDIAKSDSGRILTPLLTHIPALPSLLQWATWGLVRVLPTRLLRWSVGAVAGMMQGAGLETTVSWLGTRGGVRQTLAMAWDEMVEITADSWADEVWGLLGEGDVAGRGGETQGAGLQLVLYFAKRDHWVSDATRDAILRRRGRPKLQGNEERRLDNAKRYPKVEVEQEGHVVHGWPIHGSSFMASKVLEWVEEISGRSADP